MERGVARAPDAAFADSLYCRGTDSNSEVSLRR